MSQNNLPAKRRVDGTDDRKIMAAMQETSC